MPDRAKAELDMINQLRLKSQHVKKGEAADYCAVSGDWRKSWLAFAMGTSPVPPGPVLTADLVDRDILMRANLVLHFPGCYPVLDSSRDVAIFIPAAIFRQYVAWYGLQGPEIVRPAPRDAGVHVLQVDCRAERRLVCVLKTISRPELCRLFVDVFQLPSTYSIREIKLMGSQKTPSGSDIKDVYLDAEEPTVFGAVDIDRRGGGAVGLANIGNTCYMASALQALAHTRPLLEALLLSESMLGSVSGEFARLLAALWVPGSSASLGALKAALAAREPRFASYSQQDSQELLAVLLDHLNEETRIRRFPYPELNDDSLHPPSLDGESQSNEEKSWHHYELRNDSCVTRDFGGLLKSAVVCAECAFSSETFDPFLFLSLPIPSKSMRRLTVGVFGQGLRQLPLTPSSSSAYSSSLETVGDVKQAVGFQDCILLVSTEEGRFLRVLDDDDEFLSDVLGEDRSSSPFMRRTRSLRLYAHVPIMPSFSVVSFTRPSYIFSSDFCFYPVIIPRCHTEDQVREQLHTLLDGSECIASVKRSEENDDSFICRIHGDDYDRLSEIFNQWMPPLASSPTSNNGGSEDAISLQDCLEGFESEEYLEEGVGWRCPRCKGGRAAFKSLQVSRPPRQCLMVHLKRFAVSAGKSSWFGMGRKVSTPVAFPALLELRQGIRYRLYAVIDHFGSLFGGHYTCTAQNPYTQHWFRFDDSHVSRIDLNEVLTKSTSSGYVLFYQHVQ
jgi:ubiquitin C-terminal hydrolase